MWKLINGYRWPYRIDENANIEVSKKPGQWRRLKVYMDYGAGGAKYGHRLIAHLRCLDNKSRKITVKRLMANAFLGGVPEGYCVMMRNGMQGDCELSNLFFMPINEAKRLGGGRLTKTVEKLDRDGNVVEVYKRITEAARKNFMSENAIYRRCRGKIKDPYSLDGYDYRYER